MPSNDDHSRLQNLGTVVGAPESGLRYMRRRRVGTADRNGDPLYGLVNLFVVAVVFAVALLVTTLAAFGMSGLLTSENMTIVTNPGTPEMQVIVKDGDTITKLDMQSGAQVEGVGTLVGSFYKLADGTVVYVPAGETAPGGSTPVPGTTPVPTVTPVPTTTPAPGVTLTPEATPVPTTPPTTYPTTPPTTPPTPYPTPTPGATL